MKVNYFVNADEKIVICKLAYRINGDRFEAIGIAKCAPEDVFDLDIGMALASNRAHREYHNDHKAEIMKEINYLKGKISRLENEYKNHQAKATRFKTQYKSMDFGGKR